jgi:hypothetical protein
VLCFCCRPARHSCVDWYGNTRPIFYRDRLFALMGSEFVEGELAGGLLKELARLDLTREPHLPGALK